LAFLSAKIRDVVPTKELWERTQKLAILKQLLTHFKAVCYEVLMKTWKRWGNAVLTGSSTTAPLAKIRQKRTGWATGVL